MTDTTPHKSLFQSSPLTRRRRRAEVRLKAYGITAISLAGLALVLLLGTVVFQAAGALTESYINLPVSLDPEELDPDGDRDPKKILRANFGGLTKDVLRDTFPQVTGRSDRRDLSDLVSGGAAFELAEHVSANPSLLGQEIRFEFLASDVTDLYLKGAYGKLRDVETRGNLTVESDGERAILTSTAPDFAPALVEVKKAVLTQAQRLRRQAKLQDNGVVEFRRRAEAAETDEDRDGWNAQADARAAERDRMIAEAETLEARAADEAAAEELGRTDGSVFVRAGGGWIKLDRIAPDSAEGEVLSPLEADVRGSSEWDLLEIRLSEAGRKVSDKQIVWIETLKQDGAISRVFNKRFFTAADSREPELAGIWGATVGTFWTMLVTFVLAFPIGVLAAIYLEEFAPKNRLTTFLEININNLAAVPSIVFGLLGLAVFLQFFGVPRSAPLAGGMVLALMTLPTIIIASRVSIAAVPPSIRDAALGVGASKLQSAFHHVLPLALPGILTGAILGMARAVGETAPLILIGMVAFIVEVPRGITDSATVLPVQVYRWSDFPERAFEARTAAAICVLLIFLILMNALAVFLRRKFERRW